MRGQLMAFLGFLHRLLELEEECAPTLIAAAQCQTMPNMWTVEPKFTAARTSKQACHKQDGFDLGSHHLHSSQ